MWEFIKWFLVVDILGWVVFPITFLIFSNSKDKGFSVSKIFGLLIGGYSFWLLNSFNLLKNSKAGVLLVFLLILAFSFALLRRHHHAIFEYIKKNKKIFVFYEVLFILSFLSWAFIRSISPEITGTEKPMELAFINGIYRSPTFPPNDPWLSGYSISYYYFGYLIAAMMMHVCGTISGIAFNLSISLWFALIFIASSGVLFNLLYYRKEGEEGKNIVILLFLSLLAPFMILIVSNAEGFLELIHARGIFWNYLPDGSAYSRFWEWLDIRELVDPPSLPFIWQPNRLGGTWWWRASRVLQDYDVIGNPREIIDEFPFFSFFLADFHPHVISIPFVLLVIYWAISSLIKKEHIQFNGINLNHFDIWFAGYICGSLIFINTWDFPIYAGLLIMIQKIKNYRSDSNYRFSLRQPFYFGLSLAITSLIFYIPFLIGLSSQAGGFLPSLVFRTKGVHFVVMFFSQIFFISWFLVHKMNSLYLARIIKTILFFTFLCCVLFFISITYVSIINQTPNMLSFLGNVFGVDNTSLVMQAENNILGLLRTYGSENVSSLISLSASRFITNPFVIILLITWIAFGIDFLKNQKGSGIEKRSPQLTEPSTLLVVVLIIIGALLCLAPEFFFLRDQFGWRMNTIFKFYFQAWILFSFSAAFFISSYTLDNWHNHKRYLFIGITLCVLLVTLIYPIFSLKDRFSSIRFQDLTLDGNIYIKSIYPEEYNAINFLENVPYGVIAEAIGGSYSNYGRVSRLTGLPTILGWPGHELQWRGGVEEIGSRESDIHLLYSTSDWEIASQIIDRYDVIYIYIGPLERASYPISEEKFLNNLPLIYKNSEVSVFAIQG